MLALQFHFGCSVQFEDTLTNPWLYEISTLGELGGLFTGRDFIVARVMFVTCCFLRSCFLFVAQFLDILVPC